MIDYFYTRNTLKCKLIKVIMNYDTMDSTDNGKVGKVSIILN